jgi:hypothetical protein
MLAWTVQGQPEEVAGYGRVALCAASGSLEICWHSLCQRDWTAVNKPVLCCDRATASHTVDRSARSWCWITPSAHLAG